jgi:2-haloalkanoic acid dehalogenase type II
LKTKAILFDLGDTLATPWLLEVTFHKILAALGINRSVDEIRDAFSKTRKDFEALKYSLMYGKVSYQEYWNLWRSCVLKHLGLADNEKLLKEFEAKWHDYMECKIHSDVAETLSKLRKRGLKLAVVSTVYAEDVYAILEKIGLQKELFDAIIGANTTVAMKPDPEVFRHALKKLGVKPEEALFVGDTTDYDYEPAEKVGIKAVLIQRTENDDCKARGLRTIMSLEQVFTYIE